MNDLIEEYDLREAAVYLPELNLSLLMELVAWAEKDEDAAKRLGLLGGWDQSEWGSLDGKIKARKDKTYVLPNVCGTAYCLAGGAAVAAGYRLIYDDFGMFHGGYVGMEDSATECIKTEPTGKYDKKGRPLYRDVPGADEEMIESVGAIVLGLAPDEADRLFSGGNGIRDLKDYINLFCAKRGIAEPYPHL